MGTQANLVDITHIGVANNPHPGESEHPFSHIDTRALRGKTLIDHDGHKIGKITAVQLDHHTGRSDFFKVRRGGFLGYGTEWFLMPMTAISHVEQKTVQIDHSSNSQDGVPGDPGNRHALRT